MIGPRSKIAMSSKGKGAPFKIVFHRYVICPFINYVIFLGTIPDPSPPFCHVASSDNIIFECANDISMKDYFVRCNLTINGYF